MDLHCNLITLENPLHVKPPETLQFQLELQCIGRQCSHSAPCLAACHTGTSGALDSEKLEDLLQSSRVRQMFICPLTKQPLIIITAEKLGRLGGSIPHPADFTL